ncbi:MAG: hypothetical protein ACRC1I_05530, partial [Pseudomonas proteolytica]|uniref:hypothetical protein n=1 Tax=Pseudomonas proteolytica TaxID=219574 RepID=UPI003F3A954E
GMSNKQLDREMCSRGWSCHVCNDGRRKHDCLFADSDCHDVTDSDRAAVIKYLLAEDAEAAPQPEDKPTEDKPEPIKLYCAKDYITPFGDVELIKGTVCTFNPADGAIELPDGSRVGSEGEPRSYDEWKRDNPFRADCLVPLVKRPAKVGEWVYITKSHEKRAVNGEIYEVAPYKVNDDLFINHPDGTRSPDGAANIRDSEYLVLDGFHPEPEKEPEPEYFSGKVVCVSSGDEYFTVGKMYEFVNGEIKDDDGDERPMYADEWFKSVEEWNSEYGIPIARFIEFKGEAHD